MDTLERSSIPSLLPSSASSSLPSPPRQHRLLILYGTQTGNARNAAERIAKGSAKRGFQPCVYAMDSYNIQTLPDEELVVFVAATTGDGDTPNSMVKFWKFLLRKSLPGNVLENLNFAVFGLGDSSYPKFNAIARRLFTRLKQLGARPLLDIGLGDDQSGYGMEGDLDVWIKGLWEVLLERHPIPSGYGIDDAPELTECRYNVNRVDNGMVSSVHSFDFYSPPNDAYTRRDYSVENLNHPKVFFAPVVQNTRITTDDWTQDTRHIRMDISASGLHYNPGDCAIVWPSNDFDGGNLAERLAVRLGVNLDHLIEVTKAPKSMGDSLDGQARLGSAATDNPYSVPKRGTIPSTEEFHRVPSVLTIRDLFVKYLDICGRPRRSVFEQLSFFATDEEHAEKLLEISRPEGADLYFNYILQEKRTIVEVLEDFHSIRLPLAYLLELVQPLQPRYFSIASSQNANPGKLDLCVAVVDFLTPFSRRIKGVCSNWLAQRNAVHENEQLYNLSECLLQPEGYVSENNTVVVSQESLVPISIKPGSLFMPADEAACILIGPGTGIAPMRAIVQERAFKKYHSDEPPQQYGPIDLYFGCRKRAKDFYYETEWESLIQSGGLRQLHTAFSRDQTAKEYVQLRLYENRHDVAQCLLSDKSVIFIAGSAKRMPNDVSDILAQIIVETNGWSDSQARKYLKQLSTQRRFVIEAWA